MRVGYFGPEGTFTHEALIDAVVRAPTGAPELEPVPLPTIYDTVMAVHSGTVERALVPIENSLEGSVNATLDALAMETEDVAIVGAAGRAVPPRALARGARARRELHRRCRQAGLRARGALGGTREPARRRNLRVSRPARGRRGRRRQRDQVRVARARGHAGGVSLG